MNVDIIEQGGQATANFYNDIEIGFCIIKVAFDEQNRRADYRFVEVNSAFEQHTGLIDATGQWMRNLAPEHEQFWFDRYAEIARTGRPARFEYSAQALGGRHFEVYAYRTGEPEQQRVAVLFADISARKREEVFRSALFKLTDQLAEHDEVAGLTDVGGFLGVGSRQIAVEPSALVMRPGGERFSAVINMSKDTISAASTFKPDEALKAP